MERLNFSLDENTTQSGRKDESKLPPKHRSIILITI
jgi:hypothetical protein